MIFTILTELTEGFRAGSFGVALTGYARRASGPIIKVLGHHHEFNPLGPTYFVPELDSILVLIKDK